MHNTAPPSKLEQQLRDMNEALLLSSVKQHELAEQARKAEAALRESEQRQRFVLDSMPQKIFTAQPNGAVDYFNPQWTEFTGLSFEQIKGWGWKQFIHPDDLEETVRLWKHAVATGEFYLQEHRFRRADGEYHWHVSRALPMRDKAGRIVLWVGSNTDVQEIKKAEESLRASEVRYRRLFESAKDGILILDVHTGKITDANACMGDLMETAAHELLGKELWQIGLFKDIEASRAAFRELQEKGYIRYDDLPLATKTGEARAVEFVSNVYAVNGTKVIQCNIRDVTERKRAVEELQEADHRKDEFLAMLAHELRNPLAPIRNALHIVRMRSPERRQAVRQAWEIIERQVESLMRLVDDLLDVSRISRGRINLQKQPVDVMTIVARAVESSRPLIDARRHELQVTLPDEPMPVDADVTRMAQVVLNLLNNAAKYTPEGGRIQLIAEKGPVAVVIRVRDNGMGIPADTLPKVFDLFTQAARTLDRSEGGLGIGLTLVRRLTELHEGTVEASSEGPGHGSEFVVRLPLLREAPPAVAPAKADDTPQVKPSPRKRILVVDDNRDSAESLALLLRLVGQDVRTVHDGRQALVVAEAYRPDLVLLDIGLPGMDGYEVARRLRSGPWTNQVMLVALTGYGGEEDRRQAQAAGFDHHMVKPVDFDALHTLLAALEPTKE